MTDEQNTKPLGEALEEQLTEQQVYAELPYIVTEPEIVKLAEALAIGNAEAGKPEMTHSELQSLVLWATGGKLAYLLLQEVLAGNLNVIVEDGEPVFSLAPKQEPEKPQPLYPGAEEEEHTTAWDAAQREQEDADAT